MRKKFIVLIIVLACLIPLAPFIMGQSAIQQGGHPYGLICYDGETHAWFGYSFLLRPVYQFSIPANTVSEHIVIDVELERGGISTSFVGVELRIWAKRPIDPDWDRLDFWYETYDLLQERLMKRRHEQIPIVLPSKYRDHEFELKIECLFNAEGPGWFDSILIFHNCQVFGK